MAGGFVFELGETPNVGMKGLRIRASLSFYTLYTRECLYTLYTPSSAVIFGYSPRMSASVSS